MSFGIGIHPTQTGGTGVVEPRRTTYQSGDRKVDLLPCYQCGFPFRPGIDSEGASIDAVGGSHTTYLGTTNMVQNPQFDGLPSINVDVTGKDNGLIVPGWFLSFGAVKTNQISIRKTPLLGNLSMNIGMFDSNGNYPAASSKVFVTQLLPNWQSLPGSVIHVSVELYSDDTASVDGFTIDDGVTVSNSPTILGGGVDQVISGDFAISPDATQVILGIGHIVSSPYGFYFRSPSVLPYLTDTNNSGGCRFCGSMNPRGIGRNDGAFETGVDLSNK